MNTNRVRIRLAWNNFEFEIEGPEQYIDTYSETITVFSDFLKTLASHQQEPALVELQPRNLETTTSEHRLNNTMPSSFGEWYYKVPKNTSKTDIVLLASYFIQLQNEENTFTTREVTKLLRELGINLSNITHFIKINCDYRKVYRMPPGKYKVSEKGIKHLVDFEFI